MPPAGRFLKKAPQKLSGCHPYVYQPQLGLIDIGVADSLTNIIITSKHS